MSAENPSSTDPTDEPAYRNILVPTDDSDASLLALDHAIVLARAFDGQIHALSVDEGAGSVHRDKMRTDSEEVAEEAIEKVAERAEARNVPVTVAVRSGSAEQVITRYAMDSEVDIIVMGTEGRSGLKGVIFGSVAKDIVSEAPVPVLTVHTTTRGQ